MKSTWIFTAFLFSLLISPQFVSAQKLDKYYIQHVQEGGDIYYIQPNDDFTNSDDRSAFVFDITYRKGAHDATLNFTFYTPTPVKATSMEISSGQKSINTGVEKLYVDFVKNKWENRYTSQFSFSELNELFGPTQPPVLMINTESGQINFTIKKSKWNKYAEALTKIFYIISEN